MYKKSCVCTLWAFFFFFKEKRQINAYEINFLQARAKKLDVLLINYSLLTRGWKKYETLKFFICLIQGIIYYFNLMQILLLFIFLLSHSLSLCLYFMSHDKANRSWTCSWINSNPSWHNYSNSMNSFQVFPDISMLTAWYYYFFLIKHFLITFWFMCLLKYILITFNCILILN